MTKKALLDTCPTCGQGKLHPVIEDLTFTIKGRSIVVHDVRRDSCDNCDEKVIEGAEMKRAKAIAMQLAEQGERAAG